MLAAYVVIHAIDTALLQTEITSNCVCGDAYTFLVPDRFICVMIREGVLESGLFVAQKPLSVIRWASAAHTQLITSVRFSAVTRST
jgi:hypothetical protein